ncbi:GNAT family N-acetyltransferase [Modestobacter sp. SYSU DS0875]
MSIAVRRAGPDDSDQVAALRQAWTEEDAGGPVADDDFEDRLGDWLAAEADRRVVLLAEEDGRPVGMVNLAFFTRMPRPGRPASSWCYLGNAFVVAARRSAGIGARLLSAAEDLARERGCVRIVLSPTERSRPLYERSGFGPATMLLAKPLD